MKLGEKYSYLAKNTFLFTMANFSNKIIVFFLLPFYTAFLTTEEYAIIDLISITQQLIFPIVTLDIAEAVIRFGIEKKNNNSSIFSIGLILTIFGNIILLLLCCTTGIIIGGENRNYIKYFFAFSVVISINTLLSSFLRTIDKVHIITISSVINTIVTMCLNVLFIAKLNKGIDGYYKAYIMGNSCAILIMICGVQFGRYIKRLSKTDIKQYLFPMLRYAIPLIPNALFWWINSSLDRYFLISMSTLSCVGMYAAANKIPSILSTLTTIFQQSWGLSLFKENESKSKQNFFQTIYDLYNIFVFGISFILIFFVEAISRFLLSKEFFEAWTWIPLLIFGFYANAISSFIGTEFTAAKRTTWILFTTLVSAIVNIILNIILIPEYDGLGAAIATCVSYLVLVEIRVFVLNNRFKIHINNVKLLLTCTLMGCSVLIAIRCMLLWRMIGFALVFMFFLLIERREIEYFHLAIRNFMKKT